MNPTRFASTPRLAPVAAGVLLLGALGSLAMQSATAQACSGASDPSPGLRIVGIPDPRDMLVLREADGPFTVPAGQLFVLTALGNDTTAGSASLAVDGVVELTADFFSGSPTGLSVLPAPPGFTAQAGSVLQLNGLNARAWGYLVERSLPATGG